MRVRSLTVSLVIGCALGVVGASAAPTPPAPTAPPPPLPLPQVDVTEKRLEVDRAGQVSTDILFEVGNDTIRPAAIPLLDTIAKVLSKDQSTNLTIDLYSDDVTIDGDRSGEWVLKLSQRRAEAIKNHLIKRGVVAKRLTALGHGRDKALGSNDTDEGRRTNRRLEIIVEQEIRPPTAADLATFVKKLPGTGNRIVATLTTTHGTLHCDLFDTKAPVAVANFIGLATGQKPFLDPASNKVVKNKPFYDGLIFHRVIPGFMIQGGDPQGIGIGGPGYKFEDELTGDKHEPGTLAMANAGKDTNGSQFFINEVETPWLNGRHTVFGKCKELDVVVKIATVPRGRNDMPHDPVRITKLTIARSP
ncbi:MAG: peptidylprolyl isomerase [Deltaproteobacteria bacterium]|nr:peptidylprolyl isomerase [Deltaproteobacteria bacterium]MCW5808743.1 peptidylprolyl isomerase [Deltaproteobacteria bacterium]